jgi:hypothetical protein
MKKKIAWSIVGVTLLIIAVLGIDIYRTMPKADETTVALARIDIKQDISGEDAVKISDWLGQQKGVDHVYCNPESDIVVFSFYPVKVNANDIVANFKSTFNLKAERFLPTAEQMKGGCPVATTSITYKAAHFFTQIFNH